MQATLASAGRTIFSTAAQVIAPREVKPFVQYCEDDVILVDGEGQNQPFRFAGAPYLRGIAECLDTDHPCSTVTVRKGQQLGISTLGFAWLAWLAEFHVGNQLYAAPSLNSLKRAATDKLQRLIDVQAKRRGQDVFFPAAQRSGNGSTTYEKRFEGGTLYLGNANSETDLSSITTRFGIQDELSKWAEIPVYGDPDPLFWGRFTDYIAAELYKVFRLSTPEHDTGDPEGKGEGHCRIDRAFKLSDQRFFYVPCPHCGHHTKLDFDHFVIDKADIEKSTVHCHECGAGLNDRQRRQALSHPEAGFKAERDEKRLQPGFHIDALLSKKKTNGTIAAAMKKADGGTELDKKGFWNLEKGLPYLMRGDAPDHELLAQRIKTVPSDSTIPKEGLILTAGIDVQHDGLFYEIVAFGRDRQSWSIEQGFIDGATDINFEGAWKEARELVLREWRDAWGRPRRLDAVAVDAGDGGRANQVYAFTLRYSHVHAIKGSHKSDAPACLPGPKVAVKANGKRIASATLWMLGVFSLKADFFAQLAREPAKGETTFPGGYCHFGDHNDLGYFREITAEYLTTTKVGGRPVRKWVQSGPNHRLDCRIYAMAMLEKLGVGRFTDAKWAELNALRGAPPAGAADLFDPEPEKIANTEEASPRPGPKRPEQRREPIINPLTGRPIGE